ncbi:SDR family NAD(P)-dependent oxidoreductase [Methylobacterium sp. C25]|uniref:SDR family NAD(P)-dependent oxidoreductase n=1 Tax=Methylobacterium sp. C25 TaxID=2721622 RepID=UPI001F275F27|nr:SDR family NAD(P)-dependent oxidoreductase [Methylobacterium sp. C25]MCE4223794.1 SDR family NAD(P)-dependent oxidoreductase [Methylobacterium sp. C25]
MTTAFNAKSTADDVLAGIDLTGKRVLVTGVSAGLGVETARALSAHGAEVIGAARDLQKASRALAEAGAGDVSTITLDLASLASVRTCADVLLADGRTFDLVICNAGVMAPPLGHTEDGFEMQLGTNHLGHFVLVNRIAQLLRSGSRVISLSSAGHRYSDVDLDDPNFERTTYDPWVGYGRSKTANILFSVELDRRRRVQGIRAAAVHPGGIATELGRHAFAEPGALQKRLDELNVERAEIGAPPFEMKSVPQGAATSVWAGVVASADEIGGRYCEDCHVSPLLTGDPSNAMTEGVRGYALDPESAAALWAKSEELVGERF